MHYICIGSCGGINEKPGTCHAVDCPKYGEALEPCDCKDGLHDGRMEEAADAEEEE